jgi:hypothetical protein
VSSPPSLHGAFTFPPGKAAYHAAEVYIALGGLSNLRRAAASATESLDLLTTGQPDDSCPEFVAAAQLDLATAYLGLGSLDGAVHYLQPVLAMPPERRTHQLIRRVSKVRSALMAPAYVSLPAARQLHEQVSLFDTIPAAQQLAERTDLSAAD